MRKDFSYYHDLMTKNYFLIPFQIMFSWENISNENLIIHGRYVKLTISKTTIDYKMIIHRFRNLLNIYKLVIVINICDNRILWHFLILLIISASQENIAIVYYITIFYHIHADRRDSHLPRLVCILYYCILVACYSTC